MNDLDFPHLFLASEPELSEYTNPAGGGRDFELPSRPNRAAHATIVRTALDGVWAETERLGEDRQTVSLPTRHGTYIEFFSKPGFELKFESLEARTSGIRLLNVRDEETEDGSIRQRATIFVPKGKEKILIKKVDQYQSEDTDKGKPKNQALVESIEVLRTAVIHSFWNDPVDLLPGNDEAADCEIWLRVDHDPVARDKTLEDFFGVCAELNIPISDSRIDFPERTIVLGRLLLDQLNELIAASNDIAEFRLAKETAEFWTGVDNAEQAEWAQDLAARLTSDASTGAVACVLDSGVNNFHPLLSPIISDDACSTVDADWGTADARGHGTNMCGAVAFGDKLGTYLQSAEAIELPFGVESVKLIPDIGRNNEKLYGERTTQAASRAEIANPATQRVVCMALTSLDTRDHGRPSSWSGAIDSMSSGADDGERRLVVLAAGNTAPDRWNNYPDANQLSEVHDPGQSWNALTVGAMTNKARISNEALAARYTPVAGAGQLSPFSSTSLLWESKWPNKPDIVLEGGNAASDNTAPGFSSELDDLSILTTGHRPNEAGFSTIRATSAAAALATEQATRLWASYPDAWPETIRGLMVHSAQWTEQLRAQIWDESFSEKHNRQNMLRMCGYGVPDFGRAIESASNSLSMVIEREIKPFMQKINENGQKSYKASDMHFYNLPWPTEALRELPGDTPITIDVTLSYFVEPGPGEIGWRDKYRYRSHGLDFNIKKPTEDMEEFALRVNKAAREEEGDFGGGSVDWQIGIQNGRTRGSVHRDWVEMTAAEAVEAGVVAVFPRTGWWKERHYLGKYDKRTRYSLIVTVRAPSVDIDIYSPVAIEIGAQPVPIAT